MSPAVRQGEVRVTHMVWDRRTLVAIGMAMLPVACGHGEHHAGASGQSQQQNRDGGPGGKSSALIDPDMVAAVSSAHSNTPISMRFALSARPVIGTPLTVRLALVTATDVAISHIRASFQPGDGLQLQAERNLDISDPGAGAVIEQELSVVPQQAGVLSLNATVVVDTDGGSLARSYSIPLIAGDNSAPARAP
jgi:hypothetical protein